MCNVMGRVGIVTGAAGNLGGAVARTFASAGARLVLVDRAADRLPRLFPDWVDSPDHYLATSVDLTQEEAVRSMLDEALQRFARIDILVNVAGGYHGGTPLHETPWEVWERMIDLNVRTMVEISRAVIPTMLRQGSGTIINVASRAALQGGARQGVYSAAKSAVLRLTETMAAELKNHGINVNCVLPSTIDTPQNREAMPKADPSRWVKPEAIAEVILFLASDAARAVHGAAIPIYGTG